MDTDDRRQGSEHNSDWDQGSGDPQRPHVSQRTYWIRRVVALLILTVMIVVVVLGIKALVNAVTGSPEEKDPAGVTETDLKEPETEPTQKEPVEETDPAAEPTTDATGPQACTADSIETVIAAGSTQFPVGTTNQFSVVTKYLGSEACTLEVGAAARPVTVFSGEDRIWSSADCDESGARVLMMAQGVQDTSQVDWDMARSDSKCTADLPAAKPGTYRAVVTVGETDSEPFVFNVVP